MANAWLHPQDYIFETGQVGAVINWRKVDNREEFQSSLRRDSWETVLPELVFKPQHWGARQGTLGAEAKADRA